MNRYAYHRNTSVVHVVNSWESILPPSNDARRADWAAKYFTRGDHRKPTKPRIRVTVPQPLNAGLRGDSANPLPAAAARAGFQHRPASSHLSGLDSTEPTRGGSHNSGEGRP